MFNFYMFFLFGSCSGMVWYGMVWYGMVWYGMVCCAVCTKYEYVHDRLMSSICVYLSE